LVKHGKTMPLAPPKKTGNGKHTTNGADWVMVYHCFTQNDDSECRFERLE
jgi:hypothetical protein